jgi:GT2 family glycosyltransferase
MKITLSIIIVSFKTKKILADCLDSILKNTKDLAYEVIVVDNGSSDGSVEMIAQYARRQKAITLIDAKENLGFGKANNLGAKSAKGEYLLFLNSDTLIKENTLPESIRIVQKHPNSGAYSCRLLNSDSSFQPSGGHFPSLGSLIAWQLFLDDIPVIGDFIPSFHPKKSQYDKNKKMDWVTGAYLIVKKKHFDEAGGFDEKIFMYTEEMELCYRLARLGYPTIYTNEPTLIHLGGASGGSYLALTSEIKNMIYFWEKHMPLWQVPLVKFFFWVGALLRLLIFGIIKGDEKARRAYYDALGFII